jgi:subtilisin family serine protease
MTLLLRLHNRFGSRFLRRDELRQARASRRSRFRTPTLEALEDRLPPGELLSLFSAVVGSADAPPVEVPQTEVQVVMTAAAPTLIEMPDAQSPEHLAPVTSEQVPPTNTTAPGSDVRPFDLTTLDDMFSTNPLDESGGLLESFAQSDHGAGDMSPALNAGASSLQVGKNDAGFAKAPSPNTSTQQAPALATQDYGDGSLLQTLSLQRFAPAAASVSLGSLTPVTATQDTTAAAPAPAAPAAATPPAPALGPVLGDALVFQLRAGQEGAFNQISPMIQAHGASVEADNLPGLYTIHGASANLTAIRDLLNANGAVQYAEEPTTLRTEDTNPNDPKFTDGTLYGLNGTNGIKAPAAWDTTTGSTKVTVAVIDTGIDYTHPDLFENIWINQAEIPQSRKQNITKYNPDGTVNNDPNAPITFYDLNNPNNWGTGKITPHTNSQNQQVVDASDILKPMVLSGGQDTGQGGWAFPNNTLDGDTAHPNDFIGWNFVNNTNNPLDDNSHGTHVSGTIGAIGNNGVGVVGVNWQVSLMAVKFLDSSGSGSDTNAAAAIHYSADHGARISNNSWGGSGNDTTLFNAIDYARTKTFGTGQGTGQLFVAAAGNSSNNNDVNPFYPASYNLSNIVAVAATDSSGSLASFSNYGATKVHVAAPGVNIYSTVPGGYGFKSGTSMATPHVSGVAALALSLDPTLSASQLFTRLTTTVTKKSNLTGVVSSGGIVNAAGAVQSATDLNWTGGGLSNLPSSAVTGTPFTITRSYNINGAAVNNDFKISYYASPSGTVGADNILIGSETINTASGKTPGLHTGTSPNLTINLTGVQHIIAVLDPDNSVVETDKTNNNFVTPGTINVTGTTNVVVDNSDPGYSEVGTWNNWANGPAYNGSLRWHPAGTGSNTATWQLSGLTAGTYQVQATWNAWSGHASNAPFKFFDGNTLLTTVLVDQRPTPNGPTIGGVNFQTIATVTINSGTLKVMLSDNANGDVVADAIHVSSTAAASVDLNWAGGGFTGPTTAVAGSSLTLSRTYNVALGAVPANFTIGYYVSTSATFDSNALLVGSETISAAADKTVGLHSGTFSITIPNAGTYYLYARLDDGNVIPETDKTNNVAQAPQQIVVTAPVSVIVDNSDSGYSEVGTWTDWSNGPAYNGSLRFHSAGTGSNTATWQTTGLAAGTYQIQATWNAFDGHASNAPFKIFDGNTLVSTVLVDQRPTPNGPSIGGVNFQTIATVTINSGSLKVVLSDNANGDVVADAIRIVTQ